MSEPKTTYAVKRLDQGTGEVSVSFSGLGFAEAWDVADGLNAKVPQVPGCDFFFPYAEEPKS